MNTLKAFWAIFESIVFNEFFTDCSAVCSYGRALTSTSRLSARVMSDSSRGRRKIAATVGFTAHRAAGTSSLFSIFASWRFALTPPFWPEPEFGNQDRQRDLIRLFELIVKGAPKCADASREPRHRRTRPPKPEAPRHRGSKSPPAS